MELEYYTARPENAVLDGNGNLVITALREVFMNSSYTSARLETARHFSQAYGRFESRIRLPGGQGLWPAFWMLGDNIGQVGWPGCGEIDIMENRGDRPTINSGSMHGPGYSGASALTNRYTLPVGQTFTSDFHVFAVEWEVGVVRFYVDDNLYETRTPADTPGRTWVFDHPFTLIMNVAVGGTFSGNPTAATVFPQTMTVDYVRVYSR
jgi:beta-glucanase (GH16 family)